MNPVILKESDIQINSINKFEENNLEVWSNLENKYAISSNDFSNMLFEGAFGHEYLTLMIAIDEYVEECKTRKLEISPVILKEYNKGYIWFHSIVKLYFSGMDPKCYSWRDYGLEGHKMLEQRERWVGSNCVAGEHRIYQEIIKKMGEVDDIDNIDSYIELMKWLVDLNSNELFYNQQLIDIIPGWQKSMRYELCHLASEEDKNKRQGYDPNWFQPFLRLFEKEHANVKQHLLRPFLVFSNNFQLVELYKKWLGDSETLNWLFKQYHFPLNTCGNEFYRWVLLIDALPKLLPSFKETFDQYGSSLQLNDLEVNSDDSVRKRSWNNAFGRTLISLHKTENKYLKLQSKNESECDIRRTYSRLNLIRDNASSWQIESHIVKPIGLVRISNPSLFIRNIHIPKSVKGKLLEHVNCSESILGLEFSTPTDIKYEEYVYDVESSLSAMEGLLKYARDYGRIWNIGFLPPPLLSANHDVSNDPRKHIMLTPFIGLYREGTIAQWNGSASNYPNAGGGNMGMRDKGDIALPEEKSANYFPRHKVDTTNSIDQNKIRLEELAKAAQGLVILYARKFNLTFNHENLESIKTIQEDVSKLLTNLFTSSMGLEQAECADIMNGQDLMMQCSREISYWLAQNASFTKDLRNAEINRFVYPHLPEKMHGCVLTEEQSSYLIDGIGFHDPKLDIGDNCKLGARSGANPLIALNALIVKFLVFGTLKMQQFEEKRRSDDLSLLTSQSLVA